MHPAIDQQRSQIRLTIDEKDRLASQAAQLHATRISLDKQVSLLLEKQRQLEVASPIAGQVVTWQPRDKLIHRPVQRGQQLLTVADPSSEWQLELHLPEERMGYVAKAQQALSAGETFPVRYILATSPSAGHQGTVQEIHTTAEVRGEEGNTILVKVQIDKNDLAAGELHPGASVTAKIHCGRASLGYCWFKDVITRYVLDHLQLDGAKGRIAATDGHHALMQTGFQFPWQDAVLIPASSVFASPEFPRTDPVGIGRTEKWVSLRVGPWLVHLPIDKDGKYPQCDAIIPKAEKIVSRLQIADADARFLQDAIPRLPDNDLQHHPITLDINGEIVVRATASDQPKPTELVLTNSRLVGDPVKISVNREFLARALKLGFREIGLINEQSIVTFEDARRKYLVMPLETDKNAKRATDAVRIESGAADTTTQAQRLRVSSSNNSNTMPKPKTQQESPADAKNGPTGVAHQEPQESLATGPIGAAIELRTSLRAALTGVNTLIASLRRNKRQQRLVQSTLQSLKDLQKIAG